MYCEVLEQNEDRRSKQFEERAEAAKECTTSYMTERNRNRDNEMRRFCRMLVLEPNKTRRARKT